VAVSFIVEGIWSTRNKPPTCHIFLANVHSNAKTHDRHINIAEL